MKFRKTLIMPAITAMMAAPAIQAADITLYGAAKLSADIIDDGNNTNLGVSSNSSRFGLKGSHGLQNKMNVGYKVEIEFDSTGETSALGARNRYLSLAGESGEIRVGNHDTPFKLVAGSFGSMSDTVGDRRGILGVDGTGATNKFNERANNSITYLSPDLNGLGVMLQYSTDFDGAETATGADDNDKDLLSFNFKLGSGPLKLMFGFEKHGTGAGNSDEDGIRLAGSYEVGQTTFGALYEDLDAGSNNDRTRSAYGFNVVQAVDASTTYKAELLLADNYSGTADSGASKISVGAFRKLDPQLTVYAVYATTRNDSNAQYPLTASGYGDKITPAAAGQDPGALSLGAVYTF